MSKLGGKGERAKRKRGRGGGSASARNPVPDSSGQLGPFSKHLAATETTSNSWLVGRRGRGSKEIPSKILLNSGIMELDHSEQCPWRVEKVHKGMFESVIQALRRVRSYELAAVVKYFLVCMDQGSKMY